MIGVAIVEPANQRAQAMAAHKKVANSEIPEEILKQAQDLLDQWPLSANRRDRNRLRALIAIAKGFTPGQIQKESNLTPQGQRDISADVRSRGWVVVFNELAEREAKRNSKIKALASRRGPKGFASMHDLSDSQKPEKEGFVALIGLHIQCGDGVAVFAVQSAKGESPESESAKASGRDWLVKTFISCVTTPLPHFAGAGLDPFSGSLLYAFHLLASRTKKAGAPSCSVPESEPPPPFVAPPGCRLFSIESKGASKSARDFQARLSASDVTIFPVPAGKLAKNLQRIILSLRLRLGVVGLFPMDQVGFYRAVNEWLPTPASRPFQWTDTLKSIFSIVRDRRAENAYYMSYGFLARLPVRTRRKLCFWSTFPVNTLSLRPRIEVRPGTLEGVSGFHVCFSPLPEIPPSEHFVRPDSRSPADSSTPLMTRTHAAERRRKFAEHLESKIRQSLEGTNGVTGFEYKVRPEQGQRAALILPSSTLSAVGTRDICRLPPANSSPVAVIPVTINLTATHSKESIQRLKNYVRRYSEGSQCVFEEDEGETLIFHCDQLLPAIYQAFTKNTYGDRMAWFSRIVAQGRKKGVGQPRSRPEQEPAMFALKPRFFFSKDDLHGKSASDLTLARLAWCDVPKKALSESGAVEELGDRNRFPGYSSAAEFFKLLGEVDADFLLRGIDPTAWSAISSASEQWEKICRKVVDDYFVRDAKGAARRAGLLPATFPDGDYFRDNCRDWIRDSMSNKTAKTLRVLREAIENAQLLSLLERLPEFASGLLEGPALSGPTLSRDDTAVVPPFRKLILADALMREPHAIVVKTKKEIIRWWKAYLSKVVHGKCVEYCQSNPNFVRYEDGKKMPEPEIEEPVEEMDFGEDDD